jgi:hypothetical protein
MSLRDMLPAVAPSSCCMAINNAHVLYNLYNITSSYYTVLYSIIQYYMHCIVLMIICIQLPASDPAHLFIIEQGEQLP